MKSTKFEGERAPARPCGEDKDTRGGCGGSCGSGNVWISCGGVAVLGKLGDEGDGEEAIACRLMAMSQTQAVSSEDLGVVDGDLDEGGDVGEDGKGWLWSSMM